MMSMPASEKPFATSAFDFSVTACGAMKQKARSVAGGGPSGGDDCAEPAVEEGGRTESAPGLMGGVRCSEAAMARRAKMKTKTALR